MLSFEQLETALRMLVAGARLVATNLDPNCPTDRGLRPGCGATVAMLEAASGLKAFSVGKPSPVMLSDACRDLGLPPDRWLDAQVFSSPVRPWQSVMVAGRWVIQQHQHAQQQAIACRFEAAMAEVWQTD